MSQESHGNAPGLHPSHSPQGYGDIRTDLTGFGQRFADTVRELPDGRIEVDVGKFDATEPTKPTADFPYPKA